MTNQSTQVLTPQEVAKILKISVNHVYVQLKTGAIPGFKLGATWRISRKKFEKWLDGEMVQ